MISRWAGSTDWIGGSVLAAQKRLAQPGLRQGQDRQVRVFSTKMPARRFVPLTTFLELDPLF